VDTKITICYLHPQNETKDLFFQSDYAVVRTRFQKIASKRSQVSQVSSNKTTWAIKKWFHPFLAGCLPLGTIGYRHGWARWGTSTTDPGRRMYSRGQ